jgi:uncharacterized membrane protein
VIAVWALLIASVAAWPFVADGIALITAVIASLPMLLPLPGLIQWRRRTLQWAPLTMAPGLAFAVTEIIVNAPARVAATLTLALILAAFAVIVAALRAAAAAR